MSDKLLDLIWSLDIEKMNEHLPVERKTLKNLLEEEQPVVMTKKNTKHKVRKNDLELVASILPKDQWEQIKFPIILLRRTSLEKGIYSISGGINEIYVTFRVVGKTNKSLQEFKLEEHQPYIWKPQAFAAIKKASSIFVIGYS